MLVCYWIYFFYFLFFVAVCCILGIHGDLLGDQPGFIYVISLSLSYHNGNNWS